MKHIVVINSSEFSGIELLDKLLKKNYKVSYFRNLAYIRDWDSPRTMFFVVSIMLLNCLIHIHQRLSKMLLKF